jgi:hypothetical protein
MDPIGLVPMVEKVGLLVGEGKNPRPPHMLATQLNSNPIHLAWMVNEVGSLRTGTRATNEDPIRLARMVNEVGSLQKGTRTTNEDPIRLARMVNEAGSLQKGTRTTNEDPIRLARMVNQVANLRLAQNNPGARLAQQKTPPRSLGHFPAGPSFPTRRIDYNDESIYLSVN